MADVNVSNAVNQHYLSKLIDLSENMRVEASEDIFDARGNKLLAKGAQVSRSLQERLLIHKLKKPLEACIFVDGGVDSNAVKLAAERLMDTTSPFGQIIKALDSGGGAPQHMLSQLRFGSALSMMLTIAEREGGSALDHAVMVSLLSIMIARKAKLSPGDQAVTGLAGLLHDVGELYIDPSYLVKGKRLLPHEWSHIVVHPHTGMMLINQLESFPQSVGRAVAEHHERNDGSGYPRRLTGSAMSGPGHIVAVAETLAGVVLKDHALERAALALKIIPGEYARDMVSIVSSAIPRGFFVGDACIADEGSVPEQVMRLTGRICSALKLGGEMLGAEVPKSARVSELLALSVARIHHIERASIGAGLDMPLDLGTSQPNSEDRGLLFEPNVASREIQWHLRDIARDLALQTESADRLLLTPLINLLDDDYSHHSSHIVPVPSSPPEGVEKSLLAAA